jgi:hypothetical protein
VLAVAWAAGIIDGEGCVEAKRTGGGKTGRKSNRYLGLRVVNTDPKMLLALQVLFGGKVCSRRGSPVSKLPLYFWEVSGQTAGRCLKEVLPYLVSKRAEALVGLRLRERSHYFGLTDEILAAREADAVELSVLKRTREALP